jgi:hypothetical protein
MELRNMPAFKRIKDYSAEELNKAIEASVEYCKSGIEITYYNDEGIECFAKYNISFDFYKILNGIDLHGTPEAKGRCRASS